MEPLRIYTVRFISIKVSIISYSNRSGHHTVGNIFSRAACMGKSLAPGGLSLFSSYIMVHHRLGLQCSLRRTAPATAMRDASKLQRFADFCLGGKAFRPSVS